MWGFITNTFHRVNEIFNFEWFVWAHIENYHPQKVWIGGGLIFIFSIKKFYLKGKQNTGFSADTSLLGKILSSNHSLFLVLQAQRA